MSTASTLLTTAEPGATSSDVADEGSAFFEALRAKDARFDGQFFTGVTSTGVYCRPVCRVRTPKRDNCRFFTLASQAEAAGFRPCLRCRPELAPAAGLGMASAWSVQDASAILARQAAGLLDAHAIEASALGMASIAARLGISERHLRRIFEAHWGVSPLQYLQTRRLLTAKQLLTDTRLPVSQVALLSGFGSTRSFHTAFANHYRLQPLALRAKDASNRMHPGRLQLRASYRPPYDVQRFLSFLADRAMAGLEVVDTSALTYSRSASFSLGAKRHSGWVTLQFVPGRCEVHITASDTLVPVLLPLQQQCRALLDLDADPMAIAHVFKDQFAGMEGVRVPGTLDGFELAVRAILGQQITVQAARTLGARLVAQFGEPVETPLPGIDRLFPSAHTLARIEARVLGEMGIVKTRQNAIISLAQAVSRGEIALRPGADAKQTMDALRALPGIGDWTAQYIAMRALRWPDAFPAGDVALQKALGVRDAPHPANAALSLSEGWRPWRSYAVVRAWASL